MFGLLGFDYGFGVDKPSLDSIQEPNGPIGKFRYHPGL